MDAQSKADQARQRYLDEQLRRQAEALRIATERRAQELIKATEDKATAFVNGRWL